MVQQPLISLTTKDKLPLMDTSNDLVFDASVLSHQRNIPNQFIWPSEETPKPDSTEELFVPLIDLSLNRSQETGLVQLVRSACEQHGFFQVVNHGIDPKLLQEAHRGAEKFFQMPLMEKQRAQRKQGESCGYASSFTGRFASKLPWKETLSFRFSDQKHKQKQSIVRDYFVDTLGEAYRHTG